MEIEILYPGHKGILIFISSLDRKFEFNSSRHCDENEKKNIFFALV